MTCRGPRRTSRSSTKPTRSSVRPRRRGHDGAAPGGAAPTTPRRAWAPSWASVASAPPRRVRRRGIAPEFVTTSEAELVGEAAVSAREALEDRGTVVIIAPADMHDALIAELADVGALAGSVEALDAPVAVLTPLEAK